MGRTPCPSYSATVGLRKAKSSAPPTGAESPVSRRVGVGDFLATIYRRLGIDAERARVRDPVRRPVPLLQQEGAPIRELMAEIL